MNLRLKQFIIFAILALSTIGFQNCSFQSAAQDSQSQSKLEDSGNGGGYEGKTDGVFYHYVPNYTCEGSPVAAQVTEIKDGKAFLLKNESNKCAAPEASVPVSDVTFSPFQNDFIIVKDSVFKRYAQKPVGIPYNLAEVLCRDNFESPTFEIVSHYDREMNLAVARAYTIGGLIPDFSVSRVLSMTEVKYVSKQLAFKVDLSKPIAATNKFAGSIQQSFINGVTTQPLVCVIGGSIDTSKWSMKPIYSKEAGSFFLLPNNEIIMFENTVNYPIPNLPVRTATLLKIGLDGSTSTFSKDLLGDGFSVQYMIGPVDDNLTLFAAKNSSQDIWPSNYVYDIRNGRVKKLTNLIPGAKKEAYNPNNPVLTQDQHLIYDTQILNFQGGYDPTLVRIYDMKTDTIWDVRTLDNTSAGYFVLPKTNKLLFFWTVKDGLRNVFEVYEPNSKKSSYLNVDLAAGCTLVPYHPIVSDDESELISNQTCADGNYSVVQVSLADGSMKPLNDARSVSWFSKDNQWLILNKESDPQSHHAYNIKTGQYWDLKINPKHGYYVGPGSTTESMSNFALSSYAAKVALIDDRFLYGFGGSLEAPTLYRTDLSNGVTAEACMGAEGKKIFMGVLPNNKVFLFTYDSKLKIFRFYQVKSPSDCQRLNEFPSDYPYTLKLTSTNIGFGLMLGNELSASTPFWAREAVFVPIDGRPPIKFSSGPIGNWDMAVSADKNTIILQGPNAAGTPTLYSFEL